MAVRPQLPGNLLSQLTLASNIPSSSSFTWMAWVYFDNNTANRGFLYGDDGGTNSIDLGTSDANGLILQLDLYDGSDHFVAGNTLVLNKWYHLAYVKNGDNHKLYLSDQGYNPLDATISMDSTRALGITPISLFTIVDKYTRVTNVKVYGAALNVTQIRNERGDFAIVDATNIVLATPLDTTPAGLSDISGNGRSWSASNPLETVAGLILPTTIANTTPGTAQEIGPLANSIAQRVDSAGITWTVWYKYTNGPVAKEIGIWAFGDLVTYKPYIDFFSPDAATPYLAIGGSTATNKRMEFPVPANATVYFRVSPNTGNPTPANLTFSGLNAPTTAQSAGDILTNDDHKGLPGCIMSPVDGSVRRFILDMANGEGGAILPSGKFALTLDDDPPNDDKISIYTPTCGLITTVNLGLNASGVLGAGSNFFYPVDDGTVPAIIYQINDSGATIRSRNTLGNVIYHLTVSRDDTILYYVNNFPGTIVKAWDWINDVSLGNIYTLGANKNIINGNEAVLVLLDGSLLIAQRGIAPGPLDWKVLHISAAGVLLNTYDLTAYGVLNRIMLNKEDSSLSFYAWSIFNTNYSNYQEVRISDGVILQATGNIPQYETGAYRPAATATPERNFGPSFSCPSLILRAGAVTGIYQVVPGKTNDTLWNADGSTSVVKIP